MHYKLPLVKKQIYFHHLTKLGSTPSSVCVLPNVKQENMRDDSPSIGGSKITPKTKQNLQEGAF